MSGRSVLAAAFGAGFGLGLLLLAVGVRGVEDAAPTGRQWLSGWLGGWRDRIRGPGLGRAAGAAGVGLAVLAATSWLAGAVLAGLAAQVLPRMLGRDVGHAARLARIEAVAGWAEMLRDTLAAAAGLEQTILATAGTAPEPIRAHVAELAACLERGDRLGPALRAFAARLADPTADLVTSALLLAAEHHARNLGELLGSLADAARAQASMRMRVAASRARVRTAVRVIVGATLAMAAGLVVLNRAYLDPYDTPAGQVMLVAVGGLFAGSFVWLARAARPSQPERFLVNLASLGPAGDGTPGRGGQGRR